MTKLLEKAIARAKELPEDDQDEAAEVIMTIASRQDGLVEIDDETRAAIDEGLAQVQRGEFVPDEEMEAFWKQHGV